MPASAGTRSGSALSVTVAALLLGAACGGDSAELDDGTSASSTTANPSWFEVAAVTAVHDAPCSSGEAPSQDGSQCYQLDEALFDAAGVEDATAVEDEASVCEIAPGEVLCIETGSSSTTTRPKPGTWSVQFTLTDSALQSFNGLADECVQRASTCPTGQVAIVVDDEVVSAPSIQSTGFERDAFSLSGGFNRATAESIAARLSG
jgi:N-acetyl-beta-hexosaminidase